MGLFENFPYANFHDLNLDWILHVLKELETEITNFVAINSVKYANPIIWDITSQYETNTVVLDSSGNAYLSVQPVPAGVSLDRTEYWTKIGNFSALWDSVRSAITPYDEQHSTTASVDHKAGDWVWLENDLLLITKNINAGDKYVEGSNCKKTNVHDLFVALGDTIANDVNTISSKLQGEITARENGDKALDEKIVAEAIFNCNTPIISAVGHETDTTIADYVSDRRAPTPSAAAELAVFDYMEFENKLQNYRKMLTTYEEHFIEKYKLLTKNLENSIQMYSPKNMLLTRKQYISDLQMHLTDCFHTILDSRKHMLQIYAVRLNGLSPLNKISKGFAYVANDSGESIKTVEQLKKGDNINLTISDGKIKASVLEVQGENNGE